jgi:hypothetical protein
MLTLDDTELQSFSFGNNPEDKYYLLINTKINPVGIDLAKLSNADPRRFDAVLEEMGCVLMLSGEEMDELVRRGSVDDENMHATLYDLAKAEGVI